MIDETQLVLNFSSISDVLMNNSEQLDPGLLSETSEKDKDDTSIEMDSFVLLLAQMLPDLSPKPSLPEDASASANDAAIELNELIANKKELTESIANEPHAPISEDELTVLNEIENLDEQTTRFLNNNVAMSWIQSESFQPPQILSKDMELSTKIKNTSSSLIESKNLFVNPDESAKKPGDVLSVPVSPLDEQNTAGDLKDEAFTTVHSLVEEMIEANPIALGKMQLVSEKEQTIDALSLDNDLSQQNRSIGNASMVSNENKNASVMTQAPKTLSIPVDINNPQWADTFSEHIVWLGQQGVKSALIKLHPEELGPLEISIKVIKDAATVSIATHSSQVRDIVDQSLPRLREMMSEQGLSLADVSVGTETNPRQFSERHAMAEEVSSTDANTELDVQLTPLNKRSPRGLVDYFA